MSDREARYAQRLAFEEALLKRYAPEFEFAWKAAARAKIVGSIQSGKGVTYAAEVVVTPGYPSRAPKLVIVDPKPLLMADGKYLCQLGTNHNYHVLGQQGHSDLQICHTSAWNASHNCIQVITRLALWIRAYEEHLRTAETIDTIMIRWQKQYE